MLILKNVLAQAHDYTDQSFHFKQCASRYEGDLVAKCYFAKRKLVWEVLDGGLKSKIEIQWSDIMDIKATYPDNSPGTLDIVVMPIWVTLFLHINAPQLLFSDILCAGFLKLSRQPLFFRETNPQPRKHTLWQATSDFTGGQASMHRYNGFSITPVQA